MRRTTALRALACLAALCGSSLATAADLATLVDRADSAAEAVVLLVPSMSVYRVRIDESRIERVACRYATVDPVAIRSLASLFKAAAITVDPVYQQLDLREAVYLTMADGSQLKFFLQDNYGGQLPVKAIAETWAAGDLQSMTVTARNTLAADLRQWAVTHGGTGSGFACDRGASLPSLHADPVETRP